MLRPPPSSILFPYTTLFRSMTPHISGSSLSAQTRYAAGAREVLECWFDGRPIREEYLIVDRGMLARSEEHTSELQSHHDLVCRLLLEKKKNVKSDQVTV